MAPRPNGTAELGIDGFDRMGCIDDPPDLVGKGKKRDDFGPCPAPALADGGISLSPEARFEGRKSFLSGRGIDGRVDGFQGGSNRLALFPSLEIHRVAQQMGYRSLDQDRKGVGWGKRG